jgi:hypothetical protein
LESVPVDEARGGLISPRSSSREDALEREHQMILR